MGGKRFARSEQTLTDAGRSRPLASRVGESISGTGTSRNLSRGSATLFMKRIQDFSTKNKIEIQLAYYPPYHSKYNPIERTFGALEQHWNGELLDSLEAVYGYAKSMTWKGENPVVKIIENIYETGVKLSKKAMSSLNAGFDRLKGLERWFVTIKPQILSG